MDIEVLAGGPTLSANSISKDNTKITADIQGLGTGKHLIKLNVESTIDLDYLAVEPESIEIDIKIES